MVRTPGGQASWRVGLPPRLGSFRPGPPGKDGSGGATRPGGRAVLLVTILIFLLPGCRREPGAGNEGGGAGPSASETRLLVLAASDLLHALPEIVERFEDRTGTGVDLIFGSSGNLATQVEQGAPADLYLSASRRFVDRLEGRGHLVPGTRRNYAVGRLALVSAPGSPAPARLSELAGPDFQIITLANPEHAPYGMAAQEALRTQELWDRLAPRLVYTENVAQATQFVRTGNADAGLVALGVILGDRSWDHHVVSADLHAPLLQTAAVIQGNRHEAAARAFLDFVLADEGQAILARYGFDPPSAENEP